MAAKALEPKPKVVGAHLPAAIILVPIETFILTMLFPTEFLWDATMSWSFKHLPM
jgi:hypothetical protein